MIRKDMFEKVWYQIKCWIVFRIAILKVNFYLLCIINMLFNVYVLGPLCISNDL